MTKVTLPSGKYLIVDVPEGATEIYLCKWGKDCQSISFGIAEKELQLSPGSYTLIGVDPLNLTEDEWKVVVRQYHNGYENYYSQMVSLHLTATESGSSLLTANGHKQGSAVILKVN